MHTIQNTFVTAEMINYGCIVYLFSLMSCGYLQSKDILNIRTFHDLNKVFVNLLLATRFQ